MDNIVTEHDRIQYRKVDKLVANAKKCILKSTVVSYYEIQG